MIYYNREIGGIKLTIEKLTSLAPYLTLITGIIAAYFTYKNQLRIKSFELLLERREAVLQDMEKEIEKMQNIIYEFDSDEGMVRFRRYFMDHSHNGLILYHKIKGANFGRNSKSLVEAYYSLYTERFDSKGKSVNDLKDWIHRSLNILSILYGLAHSKVNSEIEIITLPWYIRIYKRTSSNFFYLQNKIANNRKIRRIKKERNTDSD